MNAQAGPWIRALAKSLCAAKDGDRGLARKEWANFVQLTPGSYASPDERLRTIIVSNQLRASALGQLTRGGALER